MEGEAEVEVEVEAEAEAEEEEGVCRRFVRHLGSSLGTIPSHQCRG